MSILPVSCIEKLKNRMPQERMPVLFVGHGSPLNAINNSVYAHAWKELGSHLPIPRAIVCMSAHWLTNGTYITTSTNPGLIYDFYGFPEELYQVTYTVNGSEHHLEEFQQYVPSLLGDATRGLDHGVWTVLMHLFPEPHTIPVIALSIDYERGPEEQYALIEKMKPLRENGILFIGSGNIVHNLARMYQGEPHPWAVEFDLLSKALIVEKNSTALLAPDTLGESARYSIPTDDHYRPMLNTVALMHKDETPYFFNETIDLGSISMRSFVAF